MRAIIKPAALVCQMERGQIFLTAAAPKAVCTIF